MSLYRDDVLTIEFKSPVSAGSGNVVLSDEQSVQPSIMMDVTSDQVTFEGNKMILNFAFVNLVPRTTYIITAEPNAIQIG